MSERADMPNEIRLGDYRPPAYLVRQVALEFDLDANATRVTARLEMARNDDPEADSGPLRLDGEDLKLISLALDGTPLEKDAYAIDATGLTIADVPERFTLAIVTEIAPEQNSKLEGLYLSNGTYCTQCEAQGFRRISYFPDRPDVMARYKTTIRADKASFPILLSNGNLIDHGDLDDGRHYAVWDDPFAKPSYLFALVAGDLACLSDTTTTGSGREVALNIYVEHGEEGKASYALAALKRAMAWDEEVYGLEYDLDIFNIVAVSYFNMGAMENKSLNIFNTKYVLADPETATDTDYSHIEAVIAHEYFHNWTGNRVTCRDWFQLSLKEGLTVFRDQQFSAAMRSAPVQRIQDVRALRAVQFPEDAGPLAHPVRPAAYIEINNFYTATVYEKGAEVIRMLHTLLGTAGFRRGMELYFERHDGQAATCDDFVAAMADANGHDFTAFKLWYSQAGTPQVTAKGVYDATARRYHLTLSQSTRKTPGQALKEPLVIPLQTALIGAKGEELAAPRLLLLDERQVHFEFEGIAEAPVPSLNRGFSAPIHVNGLDGSGDLARLMAHDSDPFNRWEAGQRYGTKVMVAIMGGGEVDPDYLAALGRGLDDDSLEDAYRALLVALPSLSFVADQMAVADYEAVYDARERLRRAVAERYEDRLTALYLSRRANAPYAPTAEQAGRRALRNTALAYLTAAGDEAAETLAAEHYYAADNMTDKMAALALLSDMTGPARLRALDHFYDRFHGDNLVVDKWLALQATSARPEALDDVRRLLQHSAFNLRQPNKVRALIGSFAGANPLRFHGSDGAGYGFVGDQVLALDPLNPQVAARLVGALSRWRRVDGARQALMKAELERLLATEPLSRDVWEIASKALA